LDGQPTRKKKIGKQNPTTKNASSIPRNISSRNREKMAAYTAIRLAKAIGNRRPTGKSVRTTTMTRAAEKSIAKKSGDEIPATAAATRETKARGSANLANPDSHSGGLFMFFGLGVVPKSFRGRHRPSRLP